LSMLNLLLLWGLIHTANALGNPHVRAALRRALDTQYEAIRNSLHRQFAIARGAAGITTSLTPDELVGFVARTNATLARMKNTETGSRLRCEVAYRPYAPMQGYGNHNAAFNWLRRAFVRHSLTKAAAGEAIILVEEVPANDGGERRHISAATVAAARTFANSNTAAYAESAQHAASANVAAIAAADDDDDMPTTPTERLDGSTNDDEPWILVPLPARVCTLPQLVNQLLPMMDKIFAEPSGAISGSTSSRPRVQSDVDDHTCSICLDAYADTALACCHRFCDDCTSAWRRNGSGCPLCRAPLPDKVDEWCLIRTDAGQDDDDNTSSSGGVPLPTQENSSIPENVTQEYIWEWCRNLPVFTY